MAAAEIRTDAGSGNPSERRNRRIFIFREGEKEWSKLNQYLG